MSDPLPKGWVQAALNSIADINPRHSKTLPDELEVSFVRMAGLSESSPIIQTQETRSLKDVRSGFTHFAESDVLFAKITPCMENGKGAVATNLKNGIGCGTTELHVIRPNAGMNAHYVYRFLAQECVRREAKENFTGTAGQARVPTAFIESLPIPIAPISEQRRIVAKLEKLLAKVNACQKRLDRIPLLLKRFRQAVLAAACSGKLTADWREENSTESGAKFLDDVKPLRRELWEEVEKRRMPESALERDDRWKFRYKPFSPGPVSLSENLPETWKAEKLDAVLAYIEAGKSFSCEERPPNDNEFGVPKVSAMSWGEFDELESKTCRGERGFQEHLQIRNGDLLFSRANTIELVGTCVIVKNIRRRLMLSDKSLRLSVAGSPKAFILLVLRSSIGRNQIEELATGNQNSMRNIGQDRIREIVIPFPPLSEQREIVRRVNDLFRLADHLEARYVKAKAHVDKLTQSILAKAFRGELLPQDPNDEPASVLLERIKADRSKIETRSIRNRK